MSLYFLFYIRDITTIISALATITFEGITMSCDLLPKVRLEKLCTFNMMIIYDPHIHYLQTFSRAIWKSFSIVDLFKYMCIYM